ncbi:MAG: hypothetical protein ACT4PM_15460 [Gemmatimonadales bacterium]
MPLRFLVLATASLTGFLAAACGKEEAAEPAVIPSVMVTATDYAFQMPDTLTAGVTTFRLVNQGQELHHLVLIRLTEGQTLADMQRMNPTGPMPEGMVLKGGPNAAAPGGAIEATLELQPGKYAAICAIPSPDGQLHLMKGMARELTVVPAEGGTQAAAPTPDVTIKLADYAFELSRPLASGRQVIRIENTGREWHELVFVKLEPGKKVEEFATWAEKPAGPPPGSPIDGVAPMAPGEWNTVTVDLAPGDYGFICFLPDTQQGKPHLMLGMVQQFTVQ